MKVDGFLEKECVNKQCLLNLSDIFSLATDGKNKRTTDQRFIKIIEETGELAEAIQFSQGLLPHKVMKEPVEGEIADVLITLLDTYVALNSTLTIDELLQKLQMQIDLKTEKWNKLIRDFK